MNRKQIIEIIIALGLLLAFIGIVIFLTLKDGDHQVQDQIDIVHEDEYQELTENEIMEDQFSALPHSIARSFVERFGSFSSESDYTNVTDVKGLATMSLKSRLDSIAVDARNDLASGYYGISTSVLVIDIQDQTDETAVLLITTQREESIGSPANTTIRYQKIVLDMVWDGMKWLVDDFQWVD